MRSREAVGCIGIVDLLGALNEPGRFLGRVLDRYDLIILAVQDKRRYVDLL
jgi:hypothetical protein